MMILKRRKGKICPRCDLWKPLSKFNKNKAKSNGLNSFCKKCNSSYLKEHYKRNKKYYIRKARKYGHNYRLKVVNYIRRLKTNTKCKDCHKNFPPVCMDFDHKRGTKVLEISRMLSFQFSINKIKTEMKKCDLVCSNCHRLRTHNRRLRAKYNK